MYKLEPVVADGGELIIYAPQVREISALDRGEAEMQWASAAANGRVEDVFQLSCAGCPRVIAADDLQARQNTRGRGDVRLQRPCGLNLSPSWISHS